MLRGLYRLELDESDPFEEQALLLSPDWAIVTHSPAIQQTNIPTRSPRQLAGFGAVSTGRFLRTSWSRVRISLGAPISSGPVAIFGVAKTGLRKLTSYLSPS